MAVSMTPQMWMAFLAGGFVDQIPVWDQGLTHQVGYRKSYGDSTVYLINGYQATAGAILYSPDFVGNLVEIDVTGAGATSGTATATFTSASGQQATAQGTIVNSLPTWLLPAAAGAGALVLLMALTGGRR